MAYKKDPEHEKQLVNTFQNQLTGHKQAYRELQKMYEQPINQMITRALPRSKDVSKAQLLSVASNKFPEILKKYDPQKGVDVFSWVNTNLRAELGNVVREDLTGVYVPRGEQDALNRYRQARYEAQFYHGANPTDDQIFSFYPKQYPRSELERAKKYFRQDLISDSVVARDDEGHGVTLSDMHTGVSTTFKPDEMLYDAKVQQMIQVMKLRMAPDEYDVLYDHFIRGKKMSQTALDHNMSTTKLRSILDRWHAIAQKEFLT
jgi:DNA-directed RNA polymerase specialized sigma subunit